MGSTTKIRVKFPDTENRILSTYLKIVQGQKKIEVQVKITLIGSHHFAVITLIFCNFAYKYISMYLEALYF